MKLIIYFMVLVVAWLERAQAGEPSLERLGVPWRVGDATVQWNATLHDLPSSAAVYRVVSGEFSPVVLSNLLRLAHLSERNRVKPQWEGATERDLSFRDASETRILDLIPDDGYAILRNTKAIASPREPAKGVPDERQALKQAVAIASQLGITRDQLAKRAGLDDLRFTPILRERGAIDRKQGKLVKTVIARELFLVRALDRIPSIGMGGGGGMLLSFGNYGQLAELELTWRTVEDKVRYPVATQEQFLDWLKTGRCVCAADLFGEIQAITVKSITPYYLERAGGERQEEIHPIAEIEADVVLETTIMPVRLYCPLVVYP
jgi:hypothetical protein